MTAKELVSKMIHDVYDTTGITATAGIGTNMFLCKIAMDIVAKHKEPNEIGVRIAELDEQSYRQELWNHKPITDFWRVGSGLAKKLEMNRIYTMGDVARCSINNEDLLYKLFGVNAELLIDHSWGYEPCTMESVKAYKPRTTSLSSGQVLHCPYNYKQTELIVKEMMDLLSLDLVEKHYVTDQLTLTIEYDIECLTNPVIRRLYDGEIAKDHYGRKVPKHSHGTINLEYKTSSTVKLMDAIVSLYERITNKNLLIRKISISTNNLVNESDVKDKPRYEQFDLFNYNEKKLNENVREKEADENKIQKTIIDLKKRFGKNAILKGINLEKDGTTIERNKEVGGHKG